MDFVIGMLFLFAVCYCSKELLMAVGRYLDTDPYAHFVVGCALLILALVFTFWLAGDHIGCLVEHPSSWLESCLHGRKQ